MEELNGFDAMLDDDVQTQEEIPAQNDWEPLSNTLEETEETEESEEVDYSDNGLYSFLQSRGISDPSKISFVDEDNNESEVDFNSLSPEEQISMLEELTDPGITDYEYNVINYLRQNNTSLENLLDNYANQRLHEYLSNNPDAVHKQSYSIDDYSDDELYVADLKVKYPDFTDEELLEMLDKAKENDALYAKSVSVLRDTYKAQEDQERAYAEQQQAQQIEDMRTNLISAASRFNEIALDYSDPKSDTLVIEDSDKQELISYLIDQDSEGKSQFIRDMEDPDTLIELAWLRVKGAETLSGISKYYKDLLAKERRDAKKTSSPKSVVVPKDSKPQTSTSSA